MLIPQWNGSLGSKAVFLIGVRLNEVKKVIILLRIVRHKLLFASVIVLNCQDLAGYAKKIWLSSYWFRTFYNQQGRIKFHAGRYYLTCLVEQADLVNPELIGDPIGIDLGLKGFAILMMVLCIIIRTKAVK